MELFIRKDGKEYPIEVEDLPLMSRTIWKIGSDELPATQEVINEFRDLLGTILPEKREVIITHHAIEVKAVPEAKRYIIVVGNEKFLPDKDMIKKAEELFEGFFKKGTKYKVVPFPLELHQTIQNLKKVPAE